MKASTIDWTTEKGPLYIMARLVFLRRPTSLSDVPGNRMKELLFPVMTLEEDYFMLYKINVFSILPSGVW